MRILCSCGTPPKNEIIPFDRTLITWNNPAVLFSSSLSFSSLELSDTQVHAPEIQALLGTASHFCEVVALKMRTAVPPRRTGHDPRRARAIQLREASFVARRLGGAAVPPARDGQNTRRDPRTKGNAPYPRPELRCTQRRWASRFFFLFSNLARSCSEDCSGNSGGKPSTLNLKP